MAKDKNKKIEAEEETASAEESTVAEEATEEKQEAKSAVETDEYKDKFIRLMADFETSKNVPKPKKKAFTRSQLQIRLKNFFLSSTIWREHVRQPLRILRLKRALKR